MRPRGDVRRAIGAAAPGFGRAGATFRELAAHAGVGFALARKTADNMAACGELCRVGAVHVQGACRPLTLYAAPAAADEALDLARAVRAWGGAAMT